MDFPRSRKLFLPVPTEESAQSVQLKMGRKRKYQLRLPPDRLHSKLTSPMHFRTRTEHERKFVLFLQFFMPFFESGQQRGLLSSGNTGEVKLFRKGESPGVTRFTSQSIFVVALLQSSRHGRPALPRELKPHENLLRLIPWAVFDDRDSN